MIRRKKVEKIVYKHLRHNRKDVLHGSQNLALQLPKHREPQDWDVFSYAPKRKAQQIERRLDRAFGYDIAHVHSDKWYDKGKRIKLYQVDTPIRGGDIDIISRPADVKTTTRRGMTVLQLQEELKHKRKASKQYGRKTKSKQDIRYIKSYLRSKK